MKAVAVYVVKVDENTQRHIEKMGSGESNYNLFIALAEGISDNLEFVTKTEVEAGIEVFQLI